MSNISYYSKLGYKCTKLSVEHGYNMLPVSFVKGAFIGCLVFFHLTIWQLLRVLQIMLIVMKFCVGFSIKYTKLE